VLVQFVSVGSVMLYSLVMTALLLWVTSRFVSLRVSEAAESDGLDIDQHAERLGT
jgi:ammonium transporter, Amt family